MIRSVSSQLVLWISGILLAASFAVAGSAEIIARDGSFVAFSNGVVADMRTGLEWCAGPDVDTSYYQAVEWVRGLTVAGGCWRMPTAKELNSIYRIPGKPSSITPLLETQGIHIWPFQANEDRSLYLFRYMDPYGTRGFAVRSSAGIEKCSLSTYR